MILSHILNSISSSKPDPNDLFWTIGNKEEGGKDKPIIGGLSSRAFDGSTFNKIQEGSDTLFEVTTTNVFWDGGFTPPQNGERICIELLIKNSNLDTNRGRFISFGTRTLEIGKQTSYRDFSVGFSLNDSSWSAIKLYANPSWSFVQPYYLDYAYIKDSYKRDQVVAIKSYIKKVSTGIIVSCYVDDTKVFEYKLNGATMSGYLGTLFSDMGKLTFGNIHIYNVSDESDFVTIGGRDYPVVQIGNQLWLAENLDYKFPVNGSQIPVGRSDTPGTPAAWYYNNDESTYGVGGKKYGLLYNGYARNYLMENYATLLPQGWHIPSLAEFNTLTSFVGSNPGTKLKSTSSDWGGSGSIGTDNYGFNALPAGYRRTSFSSVGSYTSFWVSDNTESTHSEPNLPKAKYMTTGSGVSEDYWHTQYSYGSIRLVKSLI